MLPQKGTDMVRHDLQQDVIAAYRALRMARVICAHASTLDEINKAVDSVFQIANKLGVDLTIIDRD